MKAAARPPVKRPVKQKTVVPSILEMPTATFVKHFNARHSDSLAGMDRLPEDISFEVEQAYRAFHANLTSSRADYTHEHAPGDEEDSIDRAIECLAENRNWGWKELAGHPNRHVAVFPDGKIATRVDGRVTHHDTIEDATDRIMG